MVNCKKWWHGKGCNNTLDVMIGKIGHVSHHLGSLLGAIELTVLCTLVCIVGYLDVQIKQTLLNK